MDTVIREWEAPTYEDYEKEEYLWSEVLPNLWQGGTHDDDWTSSPQGKGVEAFVTLEDFDTVVTLFASARPVDWFVRELRYGFWDHDMMDFDPSDLFDLVKLAHADWKRGKRVLVRCQAGWNRSGLVMALILIREGHKPEHAIQLIRERRSRWALCNRDFERWLLSVNPADWRGEAYGE